tara:strand:- start:209 stop:535 length:327 start_codon:yes stop_codon:yes gene_type:complete
LEYKERKETMKKINITQHDINYGQQGCKNNCPIAIALKREYQTKNVEVDLNQTDNEADDLVFIKINNKKIKIDETQEDFVDTFIKDFDDYRGYVNPFELRIIEEDRGL